MSHIPASSGDVAGSSEISSVVPLVSAGDGAADAYQGSACEFEHLFYSNTFWMDDDGLDPNDLDVEVPTVDVIVTDLAYWNRKGKERNSRDFPRIEWDTCELGPIVVAVRRRVGNKRGDNLIWGLLKLPMHYQFWKEGGGSSVLPDPDLDGIGQYRDKPRRIVASCP